jgi:hypothetical protein
MYGGELHMENKPLHYDGSVQHAEDAATSTNETFVLTDEMRMNISGNPYVLDKNE